MRTKLIPSAITSNPTLLWGGVAAAAVAGYLYFAPTAEPVAASDPTVTPSLGYAAPISSGGGGGGGASFPTGSFTDIPVSQTDSLLASIGDIVSVKRALGEVTNAVSTPPGFAYTPIENSTGGTSYVPTIGDVTTREILDFQRLQESHSYELSLLTLQQNADIYAANIALETLGLYQAQYQINAGLAQAAMFSGNILSAGSVGNLNYSFLNVDGDLMKKNKSADNVLQFLSSPNVSNIANQVTTGNFTDNTGFTSAMDAIYNTMNRLVGGNAGASAALTALAAGQGQPVPVNGGSTNVPLIGTSTQAAPTYTSLPNPANNVSPVPTSVTPLISAYGAGSGTGTTNVQPSVALETISSVNGANRGGTVASRRGNSTKLAKA